LRDPNPEARVAAAHALASIAKRLYLDDDPEAIPLLKRIEPALRAADGIDSVHADAVRSDLASLERIGRPSWADNLLKTVGLAKEHPVLAIAIVLVPSYLIWGLVLRFLILPRSPLTVLAWNEALTASAGAVDVEVPVYGSKLNFSLKSAVRSLSLIGRYHFHPCVLGAWVEKHVGAARAGFQNMASVETRKTYVGLPLLLNGAPIDSLRPAHMQAVTARDRWRLLVNGEGGLGKTTLALRLGLWAMAEEPTERLCVNRKLIPVLLEPDVGFDVFSGVKTFKRELRGRLQQLIAAKDPVPEELFDELMRNRRILVILDGFSEMPRAAARADTARPENPDFPVNALIVTSRVDEKLSRDGTIEPLRIDSNHLLPFINAYLAAAGQASLSDSEMFEASRRLADLVTMETGITPLLARLFAEQLVRLTKDNEPIQNLPRSVPDLMLAYLNSLNRDRSETDVDDPTLHRAAKIAAWECLRPSMRPGQPALKSSIRDALTQANIDPSLVQRLETLRVMKTDQPAQTHVRFQLDALNEYLAALQIVEDPARDEKCWREFLREADGKPGAPASVRGFLAAVHDCCSARPSSNVPSWVADEFARVCFFRVGDFRHGRKPCGDPRLMDYWIEIKGGAFTMGAQNTDPSNEATYDPEGNNNEPVRYVELPTFYIGRYPVIVLEYGRYLEETGAAPPPDWEDQILHATRPVVSVAWLEAIEYCRWASKPWDVMLPSEEQWEFAARGPEGRRYPWGPKKPTADMAHFSDGRTGSPTPVGLFPAGDTPSGVAEMAGNVWEWTSSKYDGDFMVVRGGSFYRDATMLRAAFRGRDYPSNRLDSTGFRCIRK
jgi:hypothetical protein